MDEADRAALARCQEPSEPFRYKQTGVNSDRSSDGDSVATSSQDSGIRPAQMEGDVPSWTYPPDYPNEEPAFTEEDLQLAEAARACFFTKAFGLDPPHESSAPQS